MEILESFLNSNRTKMKNNVEAKNNKGSFKTLAAHFQAQKTLGVFFFLLVPKGLTWIFSQNNCNAKMTDCIISTCEDQETGKPSKK